MGRLQVHLRENREESKKRRAPMQAAATRKDKGTEKRERADKEVLLNKLFKLYEEKVKCCSIAGSAVLCGLYTPGAR